MLAVPRNGKLKPIGVRRVLEFAMTGAIKSAKQRDPKSHQMMVVLLKSDVERFRQERDNPPLLPAVPRDIAPRPQKQLAAPSALSAWLTLDEAADYIGLPSTFLLQGITAGKLPALDVGVRAGGRWRLKRTDLDAIEGVIQQ